MSIFKSYREGSRENYGTYNENLKLDQIQLGALLRIADSLEKIEKPYADLINNAEFYKNCSQNARNRENKLKKKVAGLRGYITRIKKQGRKK